jgi:hypothetical protein
MNARTPAPWFLARALAGVAIIAGTWAAVALVDAAVDTVQRDAEAGAPAPPPPAPGEALPAPGRLFVLIIDSLRAPRAENMKTIRELRSKSLFVYVRATKDAATVPSLRAAFTGRTQRSIFAFVQNFGHHGGTTSSLFSQAAQRGRRVATFSDGAFYELAPGIADPHGNAVGLGDEETRQVRAFHQALDLFRSHADDIVVFHLTTVDHAAHTRGPGDPLYERAFAVADDLLRETNAAVGPADTLVVMGDHGHDERGRHFPGLNVPTVALYRGPAFRPGAELGPVPLTIHRYLMSWALGLPLAPDYRGVAAPQVLAGPKPPFEYRSPPPEISSALLRGKRFVWLGPLGFLVAMIAAFGLWSLAPTRPKTWRVALGVVAGATLFAAWGAFLAHRRLSLPPPQETEILFNWGLGLMLAAWAVATRLLQRMTATWLVLALPALLLYPVAAWYGWASIVAPAWISALALLAIDWLRRRFTKHAEPITTNERLALGTLLVIAVLVLPFFYAETDGVTSGDWRGYLSSNRMSYWIIVSTFARLVLFVRPSRGSIVNAVAIAVVSLFTLLSFGGVLHTQGGRLLATVVLAGAALATRQRAARDGADSTAAAVSAILSNAALLMAYRGSVILGERTFLQMEILLAAIVLTARVDRVLGRPQDRRSFTIWLEAMAIIVAAWSTLALTLYRLDWKVFYYFFPALFVEHHVGLLLPAIIGRYALPLVLARRLLADASPDAGGSTWRAGASLMIFKVSTLVLAIIGSAVLDPASEPFMAAVQCVLTLSVMSLALVHAPGVTATSRAPQREARAADLRRSAADLEVSL